jgi:hypothetical protein
MMKKILPIIIAVVVAGGLGFYGGTSYNQGADKSIGTPNGSQNFQAGNLSGTMRRNGGMQNGGFVGGEIIAKDDKSITVKTQNGGSKIVFFSDSTPVMKSAPGTPADLAAGEEVIVTGSTNSDGSITAQSVQVRTTPGE